MEKTIMCPVCGKEGIPDFRKEDVVCPCCGSDLSVYRKLDGLITISDKVCKPRGKSTMYWGLVVLLVVCSVCVVLKLLIVKKQVFKQEPTEYVNKQIKLLNDSIVKLNKKIESLRPDTICIKRVCHKSMAHPLLCYLLYNPRSIVAYSKKGII